MGKRRGRIVALTAEIDALRRLNQRLVDRLIDLAATPPVVIPPPDTSEIIKSVAELVNGWRTVVSTAESPQLTFDDTADKMDIDQFVPPWEMMGPPSRAGWVNRPETNGAYTPYIPGQGNVVPPEGGVE